MMVNTGKKEDREDQPDTFAQKALKVLAWPVAFASGTFFTHKYVRNAVYDSMNKEGAFNVIKTIRDTKLSKLRSHETGPELEFVNANGVTEKVKIAVAHAADRHAANREFERGVTKIFRANGYKYTHDYVGALGLIQKSEAAVAFLSAASITLGVAFAMANSKTLEKLTRDRHKDEIEAQR